MGEGSSWKCQEPSRESDAGRRSTAFIGSRPQEVTSGASQGLVRLPVTIESSSRLIGPASCSLRSHHGPASCQM